MKARPHHGVDSFLPSPSHWVHPVDGERSSLTSNLMATPSYTSNLPSSPPEALTQEEIHVTTTSEHRVLENLLLRPFPQESLQTLLTSITRGTNSSGFISFFHLQRAFDEAELRLDQAEVEVFAAGSATIIMRSAFFVISLYNAFTHRVRL